MKAVVDGMVYEIGKIYEFSNSGDFWVASALDSIAYQDRFKFKSSRLKWKMCREVRGELGKIKPEPVELVDGEAYIFYISDRKFVGFYNAANKMFGFSTNSNFVDASECTNITQLTLGVEPIEECVPKQKNADSVLDGPIWDSESEFYKSMVEAGSRRGG